MKLQIKILIKKEKIDLIKYTYYYNITNNMSKIFPKATLNSLLNFVPDETNNDEKIIYNKLEKQVLTSYSESIFRNGSFYLGGQIKMYPDEEITLDKIKEVRKINKRRELEYGTPCNSFEAMSILNSETLLNQMEAIIKCYLTIMYSREIKNIKLNADSDAHIISYLF